MLPTSAAQTVVRRSPGAHHVQSAFQRQCCRGLNVQLYMPELAFAPCCQMLPVLAVFVGAQRYLQRGAMLGSVKG